MVDGVQDFADGAAQGGGTIGLLEVTRGRKLHAGRPGGLRIAAGEEDGQIRKASPEGQGGSGPTHARHDDIEDG